MTDEGLARPQTVTTPTTFRRQRLRGPRSRVPPPHRRRARAGHRPAGRRRPLHRPSRRQPQVAIAQPNDAALVAQGQELYNTPCITCHGSNLQGVQDRGPHLIGVGEAAAYFQVSTGRMPLARQEAQAEPSPAAGVRPEHARRRREPERAGRLRRRPTAAARTRPADSGAALRGPDTARGGELFRLNCASCHNFTGRGGALTSGKYAPTLDPATETEIYTAMLSGPQNMPKFSDGSSRPRRRRPSSATSSRSPTATTTPAATRSAASGRFLKV